MNRIKVLALAVTLGLTGAAYAAAAVQDATHTHETKAKAGCCAAHVSDAEPGDKPTARACDMKGGGCCQHHKAEGAQASADKSAKSCCAEGAACCKDGADCCKAHKVGGASKAEAKSCCNHGEGGDCCKAHKSDAAAQKVSADSPSAKAEAGCACCGGGCCDAHKGHKAGRTASL